MTTRSTTILVACAGLCAGACSAAPSDVQGVSETTDTSRASVAAAPDPPPGYVLVPGGYVHPSCIADIPNGGTLNGDGDVLDPRGALVAHRGPCAHPLALRRPRPGRTGEAPAAPEGPVPDVNGWAEWTSQALPAGATTWNQYHGEIVVPPAPTSDYGQTLFYFGGFEPRGADEILQPVLQWGPSSAGGGSYWTFASWLVGTWTGHSNLLGTATGHTLDTWIRLTSAGYVCQYEAACKLPVCGTQYQWSVTARDTTTGSQSNATFILGPSPNAQCNPPAESYIYAYPAVFEEYRARSCQSPQNVQFPFIQMFADQSQPSVTSPVWIAPSYGTWWTTQNPPSCFYGASVSAYSTYASVTLW